MSYKEFTPDVKLSQYIDCFWFSNHLAENIKLKKIIPDGCVDIIVNLGDKFNIISEDFKVENEQVILAGPMTKIKYSEYSKCHNLIGIRFKPFGLHAFFNFEELSNFQDATIQLEPKIFVPDFKKLIAIDCIKNLTIFFHQKLKNKSHYIQNIIHNLNFCNPLEISKIANENFVTERTMQRHFLKYAGISLKCYYSIMKAQKAKELITANTFNVLSDIYYNLNYYDNAHFTKEFFRITGNTPIEYYKNVVLLQKRERPTE
ncbi:helix-turn-helix domain-containing protein [Pedobacter frigoris]|uniref:Helix-turn-helix transcriptional regulator n=1 Tax=Pedobacter frigoris TaxID=2571272 RepID=A0A4U1CGI1_9SPHI|nr:AraC family transcriptional regulator [Pedobacter frigoris]TKC05814.1 helix-turn-helix transcriptional regulator [Pedobacter frigoris]